MHGRGGAPGRAITEMVNVARRVISETPRLPVLVREDKLMAGERARFVRCEPDRCSHSPAVRQEVVRAARIPVADPASVTVVPECEDQARDGSRQAGLGGEPVLNVLDAAPGYVDVIG